MYETLRFILCAACITVGLFFEISAVIGVYRFQFVLSRMHAAALGDTIGVLFVLLGLMFAGGANLVSLKLLFVVLFMWLSSPVGTHLVGRLEYVTHDDIRKEVRLWRS